MKSREETRLKQDAIGELEHEIKLRKKIEKDLIFAKEKAEEASKAKSEFLAMMSHEIRTPMNGILGTVQLLEHSMLSDEQERDLGTIRSSGDALLVVIDEILDFSKIEAGKLELEPSKLEPSRPSAAMNGPCQRESARAPRATAARSMKAGKPPITS